MDTAPIDGTPILIWIPGNKGASVCSYTGKEFDDNRYAIGYRRPWLAEYRWGNRNQAHFTPTHWMPLPAPPEETSGSAGHHQPSED